MVRSFASIALLAASALIISPEARASDAVQWVNTVHANPTGSTLQKADGCGTCADAGATSAQSILSGDAAVQFTPVAGARLYAGLGTDATANTDPARIDFAFSFWPDGGWDVRERGVYKTEGRVVAGDVFRIAIAAGTVKYYQNAVLVYSSATPPSYPLVLDTTLIGAGATIAAASLDGGFASTDTVTLQPATLPSARIAGAYSAALSASGGSGAYRWVVAAGALPPGLVLDSSSGTIAGSATSGGRFTVTVRVADAVNPANFSEGTFAVGVLAEAPPSGYTAISDRVTRVKPALPALGPAGYAFTDPTFGSRLVRVTDGNVRPAALGRSYRTPSSTHANAWSADAR